MNSPYFLYSIGCSSRPICDFINILKEYHIKVVADVRSIPYSRFTHQYNAEFLKKELLKNKIRYGSFSKEFGARRDEDFVYLNNTVDFNKVMALQVFKDGITRIRHGLEQGYSIALMCTEYDPLDCHRFSLVSRGIKKILGISTSHIYDLNKTKSTEELENEILKKFNLQFDLFENRDMLLERAYKILENKIAYSRPHSENINAIKQEIFDYV